MFGWVVGAGVRCAVRVTAVGGVQPAAGCSARSAVSAVVNEVAHGQWVGMRSVGCPERLTSRAGMASSRVRTVRATTSWSSTRVVAECGGPAGQVVGEDCALQPGRVGVEVAGGDVVESGAFFEVADGELDDGVLAVERIDGDGVVVEVGDETRGVASRATVVAARCR